MLPLWNQLIHSMKGGIPARYILTFMGFIGFTLFFMLRVNVNIAIVSMVNYTAIPHANVTDMEECTNHPMQQNRTQEDGEFAWGEQIQSLIAGSFFWGYIITGLPGGRLAEKFGSKYLLAGSQFIGGLITCLLPLMALGGPEVFILGRVLIGLVQGVTFPAMHVMVTRWAPPTERTRISAFIYAGSQVGTIIGLALSGYIVTTLGWRYVFVIEGSMAMLFVAFWMFLVYDSPDKHPRISSQERTHIETSIGGTKTEKLPVPWKSILKSLPFWALVLATWGNNWGFYMLLTELPIYMKNILHFDSKSNSLLSSLPYLVMWIFSAIAAQLTDLFARKKWMSTTTIRKIMTSICLMGPAACLVIVSFVKCNYILTLSLLTIGVGLQGSMYSGYMINHMDLAPNFAGTVFGISGAIGAIPSWVAPLVVATLTKGQQTLAAWRIAFLLSASVLFACSVFFLIFGSGEEQEWNKKKVADTNSTESSADSDTCKQPQAEQQGGYDNVAFQDD